MITSILLSKLYNKSFQSQTKIGRLKIFQKPWRFFQKTLDFSQKKVKIYISTHAHKVLIVE